MSNITVTLYYADWCGHCVKFKPEWEKFKIDAAKNNIKTESYSSDEIGDKTILIEGKPFRGFPSIKIDVNKNGTKYDKEYNGNRLAKDLLSYVKRL